MDTGRARTELGWVPLRESTGALREVVGGIRDTAGQAASPTLRPGR